MGAIWAALAIGVVDRDLAMAGAILLLLIVTHVSYRRTLQAGGPIGLLPGRTGPASYTTALDVI